MNMKIKLKRLYKIQKFLKMWSTGVGWAAGADGKCHAIL